MAEREFQPFVLRLALYFRTRLNGESRRPAALQCRQTVQLEADPGTKVTSLQIIVASTKPSTKPKAAQSSSLPMDPEPGDWAIGITLSLGHDLAVGVIAVPGGGEVGQSHSSLFLPWTK